MEGKVNQIKGTVEDLKGTSKYKNVYNDYLVILLCNFFTKLATTVRQNTAIMEALATQKVRTENLIKKEKSEAGIQKIFPLQTLADLKQTNNLIKEGNCAVYVSILLLLDHPYFQCVFIIIKICKSFQIRSMASLLKGKLDKSLTEIFSLDLVLASNMNGIHGKLSLRDFKSVFDTLMGKELYIYMHTYV